MKDKVKKAFEQYIEALEYLIENELSRDDKGYLKKFPFMAYDKECSVWSELNGSCEHCPLNAERINGRAGQNYHCCDEYFQWDDNDVPESAIPFLELLKTKPFETNKKKYDIFWVEVDQLYFVSKRHESVTNNDPYFDTLKSAAQGQPTSLAGLNARGFDTLEEVMDYIEREKTT